MICFEVSEKQEEVRKELSSKGYMSSWRATRGRDIITYNLPSTMLWKKSKNMSPAAAKEDLKKAASQLGVKIIRAVAMVVGKWEAMTGARHESGVSVSAQMEAQETSNG